MDQSIFIGDKDTFAYMRAITIRLNKDGVTIIKARGNHIKKAVDVSLIVVNSVIGVKVDNVSITSQDYLDKKVSSITITLKQLEVQ
jgi:DNA-binding protein Alba